MVAVSVKNRIAAILLQSNTTLTVREIAANWPGRNQPTTQEIAQCLASDNRFIFVEKRNAGNNSQVKAWTHIDHSSLGLNEEE
jgi:hypothetical protein